MSDITRSPTWAKAEPKLSVLIPFLRDDPSELLVLLDREASALDGTVEIVILDDGTGDAVLTSALKAAIAGFRLPVQLMTLGKNEGRSKGRNRLSEAARGQYLLFLDSDMRPDTDQFLINWVAIANDQHPAIVFGGFSLLQAPADACFAVHRSMAARSECVSADVRSQAPEKYVYTSNLLVRRDVFDSEGFDPAFTGWGWEDVEWAMRVSRTHPILHIDNPATHMGLDTVDALARKYEQSAANFARVIARHPDIVSGYPSFRAARLLKKVPGLPVLRPAMRQVARSSWVPVPARSFALRLYRAALYAEVV
ncbi:MAG: glycosyl transferase [Alphaproteobacteria bacterium]|nr:MAG: glycosyl transferase [Alphaproteobacteria bacterium]PZO39763.1 MAG: glycosyl transferase [Alphaproteobacteria bacterium]